MKTCCMDNQTTAEKKLTLAEKRKAYRCSGLACNDCPLYRKEKTRVRNTSV